MKYSDKELQDKIKEIMAPKDNESAIDYAKAGISDEDIEKYDEEKNSHLIALLHNSEIIIPSVIIFVSVLLSVGTYPLLSLCIVALAVLLTKMFAILAERNMIILALSESYVKHSIKVKAITELLCEFGNMSDELADKIKTLSKKHNGLVKKVAFNHEYEALLAEVQLMLDNHKEEIDAIVSKKGEEVQEYFDKLQAKPAKKVVKSNGKKSK